jgi:Cu(I)/Ag(I) efflux system membrane fusion protein/cobalt-zinc-cadmium efflux system membrane fusion protein
MRRIAFIAAGCLLVACGGDAGPPSEAASGAAKDGTGERAILYWVAPMDPTYISDRPGKSPMGMDLVPVYEGDAPVASGAGAVSIDPAVVQKMGVRVERARRQSVFRHVRSIGEVEVGEDQVSVVNLRFSGWVERIHVDKTGDPVDAGQRLFEIYSPELVSAQREYLLALRTQGAGSALARSARRKFDLWNIADADLEAIGRSGKVRRGLPIRSPRAGFVLHKNVMEGARVQAGDDLYQIGDLSRIWVTAEIYEFDAPWVEVGQPAQMELSYEQGKMMEGRVAYIYPTLQETSRTLTVRLEFENPEMRLKPGMFATVYIQYRRLDDVVAVPTEAIIDSGRRKIVFVSVGGGRFEPREIATGLTGDHHMTEVLSGVAEGDEVVVSGQFLLDSESQLQEAIRKMLVRRSGGGETAAEPDPQTVFACPMHPDEVAAGPGRCSICGMDLEERRASPAEWKSVGGDPVRARQAEDAGGHQGHRHGAGHPQESPAPTERGGEQP